MSDAGDTAKRPDRELGPWETEHLIDPLDHADAHAELGCPFPWDQCRCGLAT